MGGQVPHSVKIQVIKEWLLGITRDKIAQNIGVSAGTVTSIIQNAKIITPDIDLLREIAVKIKKGNIDLNNFASSIRLKEKLDKLDLSEEKVELLLENINAYCFIQGLDEKEFVSKIDEVSDLASYLKVPIVDMPSHIRQKTEQLDLLDKEITKRQGTIRQLIEEYNITTEDLKEYRSSRPLIYKIEELEDLLNEKESEISLLKEDLMNYQVDISLLESSKTVFESEFINANKKLPTNSPINITELTKITDELFYHPSRNIEVIRLIRERIQQAKLQKKIQ